MRFPLAALAFCALSATSYADVIFVPGDQPNLPAAIAAASNGDEIVVQTSADQNVTGLGIKIDRALTIIGDPVCNIKMYGGDGGIELGGPGVGEVVLAAVSIEYGVADTNGLPLLHGDGFEAVRLIDCELVHDNGNFTGLVTQSYPAVDLPGVAELTLVGCNVLGGPAGTDSCGSPTFYVNGRAGVYAPSASVLVLDSTLRGGSGGFPNEFTYFSCPGDLSSWGGKGGHGLVAAKAHVWDSEVTGGAGLTWQSFDSGICGVGNLDVCGKQPDGQSFVVAGTLTDNACSRLVQAKPRIVLGETWDVAWDATTPGCLPSGIGCGGSCMGFLYLSLAQPIDPIPFNGGWSFLDPGSAVFVSGFSPILPQQLSVPVPPSLALTGLPVTAQVMLSSGELSGPTSGLLVPS